MRLGDRWRGQAVSGEVKQKQAGDCFPPSPTPPSSRDSMVSAFAPGYNLPAWGIDTFTLFVLLVSQLPQLLVKVPLKS